jgi:hypothetical protein
MSHEHALSSFADNHDVGFGNTKHHTWVPLKDIWYSYDLGSRYPKGNHGAEDEYLVSHNAKQNGHRYKATYKDVTRGSFKGEGNSGPLGIKTKARGDANGSHHWEDVAPVGELDRSKHAAGLSNATDEELAHFVEGSPHFEPSGTVMYGAGKVGAQVLNHPNAGPETWKAVVRKVFTDGNNSLHNDWLSSRAVPADAALAQLARLGSTVSRHVIKNPNLSDEQVHHVLSTAANPEDFLGLANSLAERKNITPKLAEEVFRKTDAHVMAHAHDLADHYMSKDVAEALVGKMTPAQRENLLGEMAQRSLDPETPDANTWLMRVVSQLAPKVSPEALGNFVKNMKSMEVKEGDLGDEPTRIWRRIKEAAPPTMEEVKDFAALGNQKSVLLNRMLTQPQLEHVMVHGNPKAVDGLLKAHKLGPKAQASLVSREDFISGGHAAAFAAMDGITEAALDKFVERVHKELPGKARLEVMKLLATNDHLPEQTIKDAMPPSAEMTIPFIYEKPYKLLSSAERKKVAEYKKAHPETKGLWDLLTLRGRAVAGPKGHIVKLLPHHELLPDTGALAKVLPGFRFPRLGVPDDRRETPILEGRPQVKLKDAQMAHAAIRQFPEAAEDIKWQHQTSSAADKLNGASQVYGPTTNSYAKANGIRGGTTGSKSDLATKLHEDFHNTFKRVQATHGYEGRKSLARNLMANLKLADPEAHDAVRTFHDGMFGVQAGDPLATEEHFTHMLNYLNDPAVRDKFHGYQFGSTSPNNREVLRFNQAMKRAYRHTLRTALSADSKWTLNPAEKSKAEWNELFPEGK